MGVPPHQPRPGAPRPRRRRRAPAREAVRLAPGSWAARLRLSAALRRLPGHWEESVRQAELARAYAPEEPSPHTQLGDLALLRGDHRTAEPHYRAALATEEGDPQARVNLGLTLLRWDSPRAHHDPAWPLDPRESGRARRALEVWSRQARLLVAVTTAVVALAALGFDKGAEARLGGYAMLALLAGLTYRQARRVGVWAYVPAMFGRAPWLAMAVISAVVTVVAFAAWLVLPVAPAFDPVWAGLTGILVLGWPALALLNGLAEIWRGHPSRALAEFAGVPGERAARRDTGVTLWIVLGRAWSALAVVALAALALDPFTVGPVSLGTPAALVGLAVPYPLVAAYRRARPHEDRWLAAAIALSALGALGCAAGAAGNLTWAWRGGLGALAAVVVVFALRSARAWWRGGPGPWRASLLMCDLPLGDAPSVGLTPEVRQAFAYARSVVLSYTGPHGPRVVGAVASVTKTGELRLIAETPAWEAIEADPRVAVFAADPLQRRFWVEVRGIALGDPDALRVTPKHVLVGEFPGRHQRR
ncbi:hypothetical protein OIE66_08665 [Nonomuraea sp. NBC_01738]|uniref:hypothetical protein n=1 Tax=Nonomuraea sp. NBC_01738 TaxID=2976003 RepID=UPI002E140E00|nr:hypothetical protein OIE66_08665 [Nonomuraea sp. NBC_01738]